MSIIETISDYFNQVRRVGHTRAVAVGALGDPSALVLVENARDIETLVAKGVQRNRIITVEDAKEKLIGSKRPLIIDGSVFRTNKSGEKTKKSTKSKGGKN